MERPIMLTYPANGEDRDEVWVDAGPVDYILSQYLNDLQNRALGHDNGPPPTIYGFRNSGVPFEMEPTRTHTKFDENDYATVTVTLTWPDGKAYALCYQLDGRG